MKNWVKPKRTLGQRLNLEATKRILQVAGKIEKPSLKMLKTFKLYAGSHLNSDKADIILCPQNLNVKLERICFSEMFFPEEFSKLRRGLNRLFTQHAYFKPPDYIDEINDWFDNIQISSPDSQSIYAGSLRFNHRTEKFVRYMDSAQVYLLYIKSSFIALSLSVKPSSEFENRFKFIIRGSPSPQNEILGINFRHGFPSLRTYSSFYTRKTELEKLFLEMNKDMVKLLRKELDSGLCKFGPLPSIEVISVNSSLREISSLLDYSRVPVDMKAAHNFFQSLGYPYQSKQTYAIDGCTEIYEIKRNELYHQRSRLYQMIISTTDLMNQKDDLVAPVDLEEIFGNYRFNELPFMLSLGHFYEVLKRMMLEIKSELDPTLGGQIRGRLKMKSLNAGISKMACLNGFAFHHSRIWAGIDEESLLDNIGRQLVRGFKKKSNSGNSESLFDSIKNRIDADKSFCDNQLSLLRIFYEQVLSSKTLSVNLWLQKATLWLSIVVTFLTIVTILPEEARESFLEKLVNLIKAF